jgi:hypothetical protein
MPQLRLRVLVPLVAIAVAGFAFNKLVLTSPDESAEPVPVVHHVPPPPAKPAEKVNAAAAPKAHHARAQVKTQAAPKAKHHAAATKAKHHSAATKANHHAAATKAKHHAAATKTRHHAAATKANHHAAATKTKHHAAKPAHAKAKAHQAKAHAKKVGGTPLARALAAHRVVVVVLYSPDAPLDGLATREARAGAMSAGAGFLAVDVLKEKSAAAVVKRSDIRTTPTVLVFRRGQKLTTQFEGVVDRETVAQAAANARSA